MINNIFSLTKVFIKTSLNNTSNKQNKKKSSTIIKYFLLSLLIVYIVGIISYFSHTVIDGLKALNQENLFVVYIFVAITFLVLITSIISSINVNYFSKDNLSVLPLPLKPLEVLAAKMNTLLAYEYIESLLIGLPSLIVFGIKTNQDFIYYILAIIVLLLIPVAPYILGSFIIMLIMSFTKGIKNKNIVQVITMIISIAFASSISFFSSRMSTSEDMTLALYKANGLAEIMKKYFFTINLGTEALIDRNIISLLLLFVISIALYLLIVLFGQKLYYRGMLGSLFSSSGISNKKLDERNAYKSQGLFTSYVLKEMRTYIRKPTYLVQLVLPCIFLPALMFFLMYFSLTSQNGVDIMFALNSLYLMEEFNRIVYSIILMVIFFTTMYSFVSIVAISKDGNDASFMKYVPVPFANQIIYKIIPDIIMTSISYVVTMALLFFLFKIPVKYIIYSLIVFIPYALCHASLILFDIHKPKLNWTNELQVVKNNFKMFYAVGASLLAIGLTALLCFYFKLEMIMITLILSMVFLLVSIIFLFIIYKKDIKLANNIS